MDNNINKKSVQTTTESMQDRFLKAFRQQLRDREVTKIVVNGVVIRIPLGIILSRMKPTKLQMNIITTIMKVIGKNVANELQKESLGSLFSKAEFGEDENTINFIIKEKDFGIPRKHRKDLDDAVKMMTVFPIEIPEIGKLTGDKYTQHSTLCVIREKQNNPDEDKLYVVTMKRDIADLLINRNTEFASLADISYKEFRSKFSYRFYLFTVSIYSAGRISFTFEYLRRIFSDNVEEHKRYVKFEEDVLAKAQKDLKSIYNKGILHYWFEYHPTAAERKALKQRGNPEEILFVFHHTQEALPKKDIKILPKKLIKEIEEKLKKDYHIFPKDAKDLVMQLTVDNINAFDAKIKKVKEKMKTAKSNPYGVAYVSLKNFFEEYESGFVEAEEIEEIKDHPTPSDTENVAVENTSSTEKSADFENIFDAASSVFISRSEESTSENKDEYWKNQWYNCKNFMERFGYDVAYSLSKLLTFESYDERRRILHLSVPGPTRSLQEIIERDLKELFMWHVSKFFPADVKIDYLPTKFVTPEESDRVEHFKKLLFVIKTIKCDFMSTDGPYFYPRDEFGNEIDGTVWRWNYVMAKIQKTVDDTIFQRLFAKIELLQYSNTDTTGLYLALKVPTKEIYNELCEDTNKSILKNGLREVFQTEPKVDIYIR